MNDADIASHPQTKFVEKGNVANQKKPFEDCSPHDLIFVRHFNGAPSLFQPLLENTKLRLPFIRRSSLELLKRLATLHITRTLSWFASEQKATDFGTI